MLAILNLFSHMQYCNPILRPTLRSILSVLLFLSSLGTWPLHLVAQPVPHAEPNIEDYVAPGRFVSERAPEMIFLQRGNGPVRCLVANDQALVEQECETGRAVHTLLDREWLPDSMRSFEGFTVSGSGQYVLLRYKTEPIYRHSFLANHWIFDCATKAFFPLSVNGKQRQVTFAPGGGKIAFVRDNNIFIADLVSRSEQAITNDGLLNRIINGAADWVYEEEFSMKSAMAWSPNGRFLAFLRFDESHVQQYSMPYYGTRLYPSLYTYKYPKAGEPNSYVSLHVYDTETSQITQVDVGENSDQYIPRIQWAPDNQLAFLRLNRLQNYIEVVLADPSTGKGRVVYDEAEPQYIEEPHDWYLTFLPDAKLFIVPSERSGYRHLYLCNVNGGEPKAITTGSHEVVQLYGYHKGYVYYRAYDGSPLRTAIYRQKVRGGQRELLSEKAGTNRAYFSPEFTHYTITHSSLSEVPTTYLYSVKGKRKRPLVENVDLRKAVSEKAMPQKSFFSFTTPEGLELNGYMVRPLGFDSLQKYPVLMYQYSGPNSQEVRDEWSIGWDQYLALKGCIVVCVDGRGTGGRGEVFRKCTYGQLGRLEAEDQMHAARYLKSLPYVDGARIGIWGWSFGGYMSSLCLLRGNDLFRMAIAVAPVTNWRYYDNIYTERYMGLPQDNPHGYDDNSPMHFADRLKGHLLILHGTADDNVHYQNAMQLANRLIERDRPFDMISYPDRNHGIRGNGARLHLYRTMDRYINSYLLH